MKSAIILVLALSLPAVAAAADEPARLLDLFDREWAARLQEDPLFATSVGVHDLDDRLPSRTRSDLARRDRMWRGFLQELDGIDPSALSPEDRISRSILREQLENRIAEYRFGEYQIPLNADSGFQTDFAQLPEEMPFRTAADYENYIARLQATPTYFAQEIDLMKLGLARGMTLPRVVLDGIEGTISPHIVEQASDSVFWPPFAAFPSSVPEAAWDDLRRRGREAILDQVVPAYRTLLRFLVDEYIPGARETLGAYALPDGHEYYAERIRHFTTLDRTPEEIHAIGLREVERIQKEMAEVIHQVGFEGSFAEFLEFLRTDKRFYAKTPDELLERAAWIAKRMDGKLPALFGRLPRQPYTLEPVPAHIAPKYTAGRYVGAPTGGALPGRYWVNTYALDTRPLYNLEALTLHEAVPGHHLQIALSNEMEDMPAFRRYSYISAFGEGWGLYSEWLGLEAGFYQDPYSNFGRLTYEMWRACRLVVDTGVHAMGWTREQMIDFLASRTALSLHEVQTETDRYISWPGQALSYKLGELKLRELRRRAEEALGERFDVRAFHDAVLANGSIPLSVLESVVDSYIRAAGEPGEPGVPGGTSP